jgi:site-specific DNA recombinase
MLADARTGMFDVIVAWREDRLYRSYRPMLDVLDCIEETRIDIELAKETFDKRIAPVKAWAAKMELEAKHDRFLMGVAGRLNTGKAWTNPAPFGYLKDQSGAHLINPAEADSVKNIFTWYAAGETLSEIRRRLIASGAQQRTQTWKVKRPWSVNRLRQILKGEVYHTAQVHIKWDGETHHIDVPRIVDIATTKLVSERLAHYHHYPAGNMRERALVAGLTRCKACNCAMTLARQYGEKRQDGTRRAYALYFCVEYKRGDRLESCAKSVSINRIDEDVWQKVWRVISRPGELEEKIRAEIERLQATQIDAEADVDKLVGALNDLDFERQRIITWGRKKIITESDMQTQLAALDWQVASLRHELNQAMLLTGNRFERLKAWANKFRREVSIGLELLEQKERTPEQERAVFEFKRRTVRHMVTKVEVHGDKTTTVHIELRLGADDDQAANAKHIEITPDLSR